MEENKKPKKKRTWLWIVLGLVVLFAIVGACSGGGDSEKATDTVESSEPTGIVEETPVATETPSCDERDTSNLEDDENLSIDLCVMSMKLVLNQNFEDRYTIQQDENVITVNLWQDGVSLGAALAASGDESSIESWNTLVESMKSMTASMQKVLNDNGHGDVAVLTQVVNDANTDNVLLSISLGTVLYDAVNNINLLG